MGTHERVWCRRIHKSGIPSQLGIVVSEIRLRDGLLNSFRPYNLIHKFTCVGTRKSLSKQCSGAAGLAKK